MKPAGALAGCVYVDAVTPIPVYKYDIGVSTLNNVIQLGFDSRDDKFFWIDEYIWDDNTVESIHRPTEIMAFRRMFKQSSVLRKNGISINLSQLHRHIMVMEYSALNSETPVPNIYNWISARVRGITPSHVEKILEECSLIMWLRDSLSLPALVIDWPVANKQKGSRAA